jgi:hypothetical protein
MMTLGDGVADGETETETVDDADARTEDDAVAGADAEDAGDDGVVIAAARIVTLNVAEAVCTGDAVSETVTATEYVPDLVGVPLIVPVEPIVSPAGSPVADHVSVPAPPVAATVAVKAVPTIPLPSEEVVMDSAGALTVRLSVAIAVCAGDALSVTVAVTEYVPVSVGVPLIVPVEPIASPVGSPVADHLSVPLPPLAVTVAEYAVPEVPAASEEVVTESAGALTVRLSVEVAVFAGEEVSLTDSLAEKVPASVGVPLMVSVPALAVAVSPVGRPVTAAHLKVPSPPVAVAVAE